MTDRDESNQLQKNSEEVLAKVIEASDPEETKKLLSLFNVNIAKKNAIRLDTINGLIDSVLGQVQTRLDIRPDEFSNKDLVDYLNALYQAAEKSGKTVSSVNELPTITLNQQNNQVNVSIVDGLSRESKEKIADAIKAILNSNKSEIKLEEVEENGNQES